MIYAMSDLHGCYELFVKMLDKIHFSDSDTLYVLGDVLDRGKDGMKILKYIKDVKNIIPLLGNHEYISYAILKEMYSPVTKSKNKLDYSIFFKDWAADGGWNTYLDFEGLSDIERREFFNVIENMLVYDEISVGNKRFILSHAGLGNFNENKSLSEYTLDDLIWARMDYNRTYFTDKYLVSGHTPTKLINDEYACKIYRKNNHIAIDCGAVFSGVLGCIRLDDFKEFYLEG